MKKQRWVSGSCFRTIVLTAMFFPGLTLSAVGQEQAARQAPERQAELVLEASGIMRGLIVHLGCGDGRLTGALHANEACLVQGLDTDPAHVAQTRAHLQELGLYGKVAANSYDGRRLPYIDNVVNLLVVQDASWVVFHMPSSDPSFKSTHPARSSKASRSTTAWRRWTAIRTGLYEERSLGVDRRRVPGFRPELTKIAETFWTSDTLVWENSWP